MSKANSCFTKNGLNISSKYNFDWHFANRFFFFRNNYTDVAN